MKIAVVAPVFGHSSYSFVAREIILELDSRGHDVDVVPLTTPQDEDYVDDDIKEVASMINPSASPASMCSDAEARLAVTTPTMADTMKDAGLDPGDFLLHTVWETDRLPWSWAKDAAKWGAVATTTESCHDAIDYYGNVNMVDTLVPLSVDSNLFTPYGRSASSDNMRFLTVIDVTPRKGLEFLIDAFVNNFAGREDVELLIKGWSSYGDLNAHKLQGMAMAINQKTDSQIMVETDKLSPLEMRDLYKSSHAFVLPTRGEGWCRPAVEALASGCYPIVTGWLAPMEVLPWSSWHHLDYDLTTITDDRAFGDYQPPQRWATPSVEDLGNVMTDIADNYHDTAYYRKAARKGSKQVTSRWTPTNMGTKLEQALMEVF